MNRRANPNIPMGSRRAYAVAPAKPTQAIAPDCRFYLGDRPCIKNRLCTGCQHYEPYAQRICIIKLGALGDVIRTLCILPKLRQQSPEAHITWVSMPNGCRMLNGHRMIDRLMPFDAMAALVLGQESFDQVICLDKEAPACALAKSLFAKEKLGIGLSEHGTPVPANTQAQGYFNLGLSDELKFHQNTQSYPQLIYEALGMTYRGQKYELAVNDLARDRVRLQLIHQGWQPNGLTLGINVGAGRVFANKMWPPSRIVDVIQQVRDQHPELQIVLLGGPDERPIVKQIVNHFDPGQVIDGGTEHDEPSFVGLVDACDVVFSGDTMAMHVGIALGKRVVVVFGPTCQQEIDLFGQGEKLVAKVACGPCYKKVCDQGDVCVHQVETTAAVDAIGRQLSWISQEQSQEKELRRKAG